MDNPILVRDLRVKESFMVDDQYLNGYAALCGVYATAVYFVLCRHANKEQVCWPSKKTIGLKLGMSERAVFNAVKVLEKWGIIVTAAPKRTEKGTWGFTVYTLVDKSCWLAKNSPSAPGAGGITEQSPSANDDSHRRHLVPTKGYPLGKKGLYKKEGKEISSSVDNQKGKKPFLGNKEILQTESGGFLYQNEHGEWLPYFSSPDGITWK